jgi:hypothetical protein
VYNLYHAVRAFSHCHPQDDDVTAVVIKVGKVAPPNHPTSALPDDPVLGDGLAANGVQDIVVATITSPERPGDRR